MRGAAAGVRRTTGRATDQAAQHVGPVAPRHMDGCVDAGGPETNPQRTPHAEHFCRSTRDRGRSCARASLDPIGKGSGDSDADFLRSQPRCSSRTPSN